jgi:long-chain acyl-CoA synthetase
MSLATILPDSASVNADRVALRLGDAAMTYRELDDDSARVAGLLRDRGIQPGDPVGVMLPNTPEFAQVYYGVLRAGGVVVPMNPLLKAREVAYYLGDSGGRLLFAWHGFADEASAGAKQVDADTVVVDPASFGEVLASARPDREVAGRQEDDTAVILFTSGTTGQPKGAELTHANLARNTEVVRTDLEVDGDRPPEAITTEILTRLSERSPHGGSP